MRAHSIKGVAHVGEIRLKVVVERSRDTEDEGIDFGDTGEVVRSRQTTRYFSGGHLLGRNVFDVRSTGAEFGDFTLINIEANDVKSGTDVS